MLEIGQYLGSYRIVRRLGEGGMGAVFAAIHDQIGRHVAIKVLHPQFARDAGVAQRFLNEARAVNLVSHPGLVEIHDLGQLPDGSAFIVMELLRGETLTARMARRGGHLELPELLPILYQLLAALRAAHEKGVVHRDLKPDNVMLIPDHGPSGGDRVKLLDFGIARVAGDAAGEGAQALTRTGAMLGTPLYMAPEQCMGRRQIDGQADVYAMGAMLFHLLAGRPPFLCEDGGVGAILAKHIYEAPPSLATLVPVLSPHLISLVESMLQKEPAARPSIARVVQELDVCTEQLRQRAALLPHDSAVGAGERDVLPRRLPVLNFIGALIGAATLIIAAGAGMKSSRGRYLLASAGQSLLANAGHPARAEPRRESVAPETNWEIRTDPAGAQIIRLQDGAVLGVTPWQQRAPQEPGAIVVRVRKAGFVEGLLVHDLAKSETQTLSLRSLPAPLSVPRISPLLRSHRKPAGRR